MSTGPWEYNAGPNGKHLIVGPSGSDSIQYHVVAEAFAKDDAILMAASLALLGAVRFTKDFLSRLENGTGADDPLTQLRMKFHKPLHDALDAALTKAEAV